ARAGQDHLDALEGEARLLPDVLAHLAAHRMAPGLPGHEDEIAELRGEGQVGVGAADLDPDDLLAGHQPSPTVSRNRRSVFTCSSGVASPMPAVDTQRCVMPRMARHPSSSFPQSAGGIWDSVRRPSIPKAFASRPASRIKPWRRSTVA